jgi:hypothetical protein
MPARAQQRKEPRAAGDFFPHAHWVGTLRNASETLSCRFVIITTQHGMVNPDDVISPYDLHIVGHSVEVHENWLRTIPRLIDRNRYENGLLIFYAGGCPREPMVDLMRPILRELCVDLLSFGRPNMFDVNKIEEVFEQVSHGTTIGALKGVLRLPDRLLFERWRDTSL